MPSSSENQRRSKSHNNKPSSSSSSRRPNNRPSSDADYARRLQEEYRREFIQRRASAPVEEMVIEQPRVFAPVPPTIAVDDAVYARQLQYELEQEDRQREEARKSNRRRYEITPVSNSFPLDEDERLAQEFQDEELARQIAAKPPTPRIYVPTTHPTHRYHSNSNHIQPPPSFPHCNSTPLTSSTASDTSSEEVARRIAQEMDDAEIAHRLARYEQEAQATQRQERQGRSSRVLFRRVLPLLCCGIVVAIALLFILGVFDPQDVPFVGDIRRGDDWVDPFAGDVTFTGGGDAEIPVVDAQEQMGWPTDGRSGISLEILNALEDKWQEVLSTAVDNWDAGFPIDSLTLRITRVSYETVCEAVTGKIKVCNADYGDTRWRGLNELMLNKRTNTIVSSAAKMNEFYLGSDTEDQKLYTMCHELGHGFGLPHWDEDFFNKDMGNCMDYT